MPRLSIGGHIIGRTTPTIVHFGVTDTEPEPDPDLPADVVTDTVTDTV